MIKAEPTHFNPEGLESRGAEEMMHLLVNVWAAFCQTASILKAKDGQKTSEDMGRTDTHLGARRSAVCYITTTNQWQSNAPGKNSHDTWDTINMVKSFSPTIYFQPNTIYVNAVAKLHGKHNKYISRYSIVPPSTLHLRRDNPIILLSTFIYILVI